MIVARAERDAALANSGCVLPVFSQHSPRLDPPPNATQFLLVTTQTVAAGVVLTDTSVNKVLGDNDVGIVYSLLFGGDVSGLVYLKPYISFSGTPTASPFGSDPNTQIVSPPGAAGAQFSESYDVRYSIQQHGNVVLAVWNSDTVAHAMRWGWLGWSWDVTDPHPLTDAGAFNLDGT